MNQIFKSALSVAVTLLMQASLNGQPAETSDAVQTDAVQIVVFPTGTQSPNELANAVSGVFGGDVKMTVTPLIQQSAVVVRASQGDLDRILELMKSLTPPVHSIRIRLILLESESPLFDRERAMLSGPIDQVTQALEGLKSAGRFRVFNDMELTLMENQQAKFQVGENLSVPTGLVQMPGGRSSTQLERIQVGTIVMIRGKLDANDAVLELDYEKSFLRSRQQPQGAEEPIKPQDILTLSHQSTQRIPSGHAQLAGTMTDVKSDDRSVTHVLIVSAEKL